MFCCSEFHNSELLVAIATRIIVLIGLSCYASTDTLTTRLSTAPLMMLVIVVISAPLTAQLVGLGPLSAQGGCPQTWRLCSLGDERGTI